MERIKLTGKMKSIQIDPTGTRETVTLPDGYNGSVVECYREPVERDGKWICLEVVGCPWLIKWVTEDYISLKVG